MSFNVIDLSLCMNPGTVADLLLGTDEAAQPDAVQDASVVDVIAGEISSSAPAQAHVGMWGFDGHSPRTRRGDIRRTVSADTTTSAARPQILAGTRLLAEARGARGRVSHRELVALYTQAVGALYPGSKRELRAEANLELAELVWGIEPEWAADLCERAAAIYRELCKPRGEATARILQSKSLVHYGERDVALASAARAVEICEGLAGATLDDLKALLASDGQASPYRSTRAIPVRGVLQFESEEQASDHALLGNAVFELARSQMGTAARGPYLRIAMMLYLEAADHHSRKVTHAKFSGEVAIHSRMQAEYFWRLARYLAEFGEDGVASYQFSGAANAYETAAGSETDFSKMAKDMACAVLVRALRNDLEGAARILDRLAHEMDNHGNRPAKHMMRLITAWLFLRQNNMAAHAMQRVVSAPDYFREFYRSLVSQRSGAELLGMAQIAYAISTYIRGLAMFALGKNRDAIVSLLSAYTTAASAQAGSRIPNPFVSIFGIADERIHSESIQEFLALCDTGYLAERAEEGLVDALRRHYHQRFSRAFAGLSQHLFDRPHLDAGAYKREFLTEWALGQEPTLTEFLEEKRRQQRRNGEKTA